MQTKNFSQTFLPLADLKGENKEKGHVDKMYQQHSNKISIWRQINNLKTWTK